MEFLKSDSFEWEGAEVLGEVVHPEGSSEFEVDQQQQQDGGTLDIDKRNWGPEEIKAYALLRSKRKKCIISGCTSRSRPLARSYHQLPVRNLDVWQKWVEAIRWSKNEPEWLPSTDQPLICSRHFNPVTDFVSYEGSSRSRLNHTAFPSLYIDPAEGTVMDPMFMEEREPPRFVNCARNRSSNPQKASNLIMIPPLKFQPSPAVNSVNSNQKYKGENMEPREFMEVTPEFNFEETSEYHGEGAYGQEEEEEDVDGYEDQVKYGNRSQNTSMFYPDTEMTELDADDTEEDFSYPQPPVLYRNQASAAARPKLSISSFMGQIRSQNQKPKINVSIQPIQHQMPRRVIRQNTNLRPAIPGGSNGTSSIKIERVEGNAASKSNSFPGKILMKIPPNKSSGGAGPTQKHKIGMSKCRLIVESIERQLEEELQAIKARVAQEMGVPTQVVHGVWQIKDKIKNGSS